MSLGSLILRGITIVLFMPSPMIALLSPYRLHLKSPSSSQLFNRPSSLGSDVQRIGVWKQNSALSVLGSLLRETTTTTTTDFVSSSSRSSSLINAVTTSPFEAVVRSTSSSDFKSPRSSDRTTTQTAWNEPAQQQSTSFLQSFWMPVLSSSMLITGNTFGAGSLVLPQLAAAPGLGPSMAIFASAYVLNLLSGITLANVAITQYENSMTGGTNKPRDIPSSFQEFVEANLNHPELAMFISAVSFAVNSLILAFDISRVGVMFQGAGVDSMMASMVWSASLVALVATQTQERMSQAASLCVMVLFASFGSLLLPGLASLTNPLADLLEPGTAASNPDMFWHSISEIAPVIVVCTIFQNIVPTIVKLHDYDRTKSYSAIVMGSFLPLVMYVAWCWACLGQGGIDLESTLGALGSNPLLTIFSLATLAGSSIGCSLSCAAELDIFVKKQNKNGVAQNTIPGEEEDDEETFHLASVLGTVGLALGLNVACTNGGDLVSALHLAGSLGSPILYGTIPALMAYKQMKQETIKNNPIEKAGLGVLGFASTGMLFGNIADFVASMMMPTMVPTAVAMTESVAAVL